MPRLVVLDAALADLAAIREYVTRESRSIATARKATDRLRQRCAKLASLPGTLGRERLDLAPGLRSVPEGSYLILFRYAADRFEVVRILHASRDLAAALRQPPPGIPRP